MSDKIDCRVLREKLGIWFPPMPTPTEHARILKDASKWGVPVSWHGMRRAQKKKARQKWRDLFGQTHANMLIEAKPTKTVMASSCAVQEESPGVRESPPPYEKSMPRGEALERNAKKNLF